jgi:hypothetical protein
MRRSQGSGQIRLQRALGGNDSDLEAVTTPTEPTLRNNILRPLANTRVQPFPVNCLAVMRWLRF